MATNSTAVVNQPLSTVQGPNNFVQNVSLFPFQDLPIELQLRVVQSIVLMRDLLRFRLLSTRTNALVMEPLFWQEISLSKQLYIKNVTNLKSHYPLTWIDVEKSFNSFISRLSTLERTANGIHTILIEDWEGDDTMAAFWRNLVKFSSLKELSIKHSALKSIHPGALFESSKPWQHLTRFDVRACSNLCDISGILQQMPHLHDLCLEGCRNLLDFSPLAPFGRNELPYEKINLANTKIHDPELIELLKRSPHLQELRLEQCYQLTATSVEAIGYGSGKSKVELSDDVNEIQIDVDPILDHSILQPTLLRSYCPNLRVLSLKECSDLEDETIRALAGCQQLEFLIIRGLRRVNEETLDWLHSQGVPLRKALSPLGRWRYWLH
ncbi:hypothetical protein BGZ49_009214 [Haplosporangium sp. Z 27]|nr:hypothetical protein BGZ49_009214 [Haplosporangium sp. Z 27]